MPRDKAAVVLSIMAGEVRRCSIPDYGFDPEPADEPPADCGGTFFEYELDFGCNTFVKPVVCPVCYLGNYGNYTRGDQQTRPQILAQLKRLIKHGT